MICSVKLGNYKLYKLYNYEKELHHYTKVIIDEIINFQIPIYLIMLPADFPNFSLTL